MDELLLLSVEEAHERAYLIDIENKNSACMQSLKDKRKDFNVFCNTIRNRKSLNGYVDLNFTEIVRYLLYKVEFPSITIVRLKEDPLFMSSCVLFANNYNHDKKLVYFSSYMSIIVYTFLRKYLPNVFPETETHVYRMYHLDLAAKELIKFKEIINELDAITDLFPDAEEDLCRYKKIARKLEKVLNVPELERVYKRL